MKEKNKRKFIQIFAIAVIMFFIASSTYAYFAAQVGNASSTDIIVNTSTVDSLTFETGDAINISATQSNFGSGDGNQSDDTYASATLVANNDTNEASANYYLYIKIDTNDFEYTTSDKTAELILTITDPDGNEVTSLSGLTYISVTDGEGNTISGFDITSKMGLITIAEDYLIESTGTNTQKWNIEVTLVNLDSDQSENAGKSFSASIVIQSDTYGYNTLQAYESGSEIWSSTYKSSITKIVFDDSGSNIDKYEVVYDITDYSSYCTFDGEEVYNYDSWSTTVVTENSCNTVYKVTDDDYTEYIDDSYTSYITEYGSAVWDSEDNVCKTSDGNEVYTWYYGNSPTEEQCSGTIYYESDYGIYLVGAEYVGNGEWVESASSIYAYIVNNGNDTYTVYIESDLPIYGNSDMSYWFYNFISLESIVGLDKINTSNVVNMQGIFQNHQNLSSLDLSSWDTSNVIDMSSMFYNQSSGSKLSSITFGDGWNTSKVTTMSGMFSACSNMTSLDLSIFDTSNVTDMTGMFWSCTNLIELNLSNFNTSNVESVDYMFSGCISLISLNLSNADFSNVTSYTYMFSGVSSSITVTVKDSIAYDFITARLGSKGTVFIA